MLGVRMRCPLKPQTRLSASAERRCFVRLRNVDWVKRGNFEGKDGRVSPVKGFT